MGQEVSVCLVYWTEVKCIVLYVIVGRILIFTCVDNKIFNVHVYIYKKKKMSLCLKHYNKRI